MSYDLRDDYIVTIAVMNTANILNQHRYSGDTSVLRTSNRIRISIQVPAVPGNGGKMKKKTKAVHQIDGTVMRRSEDMRQLLNLNYLFLSNKAHVTGEYDFPVLHCDTDIVPDYLALYDQPGQYHKTANTGVCFYRYDNAFDGMYGLFNAIYYQDRNLLTYYKERFRDVKYIISPDYSQFGDLQKVENLYRLWKARIVSLWFIIEMGAIVIPNVTYVSVESFPLFFSGIEECSVVAFSTKGHIRNTVERELLRQAVRYSVDHLPLKTIVVYSVCGNDATSLALFRYATERGIRIVIPENSLRERNMRRRYDI